MPKEPTDAEVAGFVKMLADSARADVIPKMQQSIFCIAVLDGTPDPYIAMQVGLALLLEKPLIILALQDTWVPERLRQLADAIVIGQNVKDPETQAKMMAAIESVQRKRGMTRQ